MSAAGKTWIGADPGGRGNFGLAILRPDGTACTWCLNCTDDAITVIRENVAGGPGGAGVDAPLWWSSGRSSARRADQWLRDRHHLSGGKVQAANSLRGAALVQGMMFVQRLRELFPGTPVSEAHPKAVMKGLKKGSGQAFFKHFGVRVKRTDFSEHERDAAIAAVAAREGFEGRWPNDLSATRGESEQDPSTFWLAPVHYFWPVE